MDEIKNRFSDNLSLLKQAQGGDRDAMAELMDKNGGLIRGIAGRFRNRGVEYEDLVSETVEESSVTVKKRADAARRIQRSRFEGIEIKTNAEMGEREMRQFCALSPECEAVLKEAFETLHLSARARARILKVARTIADLELSENITPEHLYEAISYRTYGAGEE